MYKFTYLFKTWATPHFVVVCYLPQLLYFFYKNNFLFKLKLIKYIINIIYNSCTLWQVHILVHL
jgi:hypothetical protein